MRYIIYLILALMLPANPAVGQDDMNHINPEIAGHSLSVTLLPETSCLIGSDVVTLAAPVTGTFSFTLNKNLTISQILCDGSPVEFERVPYAGTGVGETEEWDTVNTINVKLPIGAVSFEIAYEGMIYDPIDPSSALGRVRGDYTSGIISPDGVYLSSETGWYPDTACSMAIYNMVVTVPDQWYPVTQGNLTDSFTVESAATRVTSFATDIPSDGCVLVANEYIVTTRNIAGVDCSTYFYEDDSALAASFLDKLEQYLPAYVNLFGPYPYTKFDVAENFFTTGYGMPSFTLLGSRVLRMPYATAEGSLAHELVHNWWGNYVFTDWDSGNWCEGLTYFSTNYYWNILDGRPEDAEAFRLRSMVRYSFDVSPEEDYPVRQFRTKMSEIDGAIGYDKSSAIFIMLMEKMGEDKFFHALRLGVEHFGGYKTSWDDWRSVFEAVSGEDLSDFFASWLDNRGAPDFMIENFNQEEQDDGWHVSFMLRQTCDQFNFNLPIRFTLENGEEVDASMPVFALSQSGEYRFPDRVVSIELDPDHYVFRKLGRAEIAPCLKSTLEADSLLIVIPSVADDTVMIPPMMGVGGPGGGMTEMAVKQLYESMAQSVIDSGLNATIKYDTDVTDDDLKNSSILCFGAPRENVLAGTLSQELSEPVKFMNNSFIVNDIEYSEEGCSTLVSVRNPFNIDYDITFYFGNSPQSIFKASYIFFYNWDSFVVYLDGNVVDRGNWDLGPGPYYYTHLTCLENINQ